MTENKRKLFGLATLYEQVGRAVYAGHGRATLLPAQWSTLRYFRRAGSGARTVSGLAEYLGITKGPASRATRALERRGLLKAEVNPSDARGSIFTLTEQGVELLEQDPQVRLVDAFERLEDQELATLFDTIKKLAEDLKT